MDAVIGLGSNLGSREAMLRAAVALLGQPVVATSRLYRTPAMVLDERGPPQPEFLNAAVRVRTELAPLALLREMHRVEAQLGRVRVERWGPRTLDLDLLYWEGGAVDEPGLTVPHPGLGDRAFALAPLLDVAPELDPALGPRLAALEPAAAIGWAETPARGGSFEVTAIDDADALALALGAALGGARAPAEVLPIEAVSPTELVQAAGRLAGARPAAVVLDSLSPLRARLVLDPPGNRAISAPSLVRLGGGACRIARGGPILL